MTTAFRKRIRQSIQNESLQAALDANAERRVKGRLAAWATLPDWRERRQRANAVRAEVIANLDEYLEKFIAKARENGMIVHRATDAAEAVQIVLKIVKDSTQRTPSTQRDTKKFFAPLRDLRGKKVLIAKSKSMVSEEIGFNHALEAEGIQVVETDLGEYIVQLRGERPSHIITPAVHLRRDDVGRLFQEKLGIPYTEEIPVLTNTARKVLREIFLTADIGLSGVNFGVAETGTLCIVTNEGNGRMVTTLPPVHIALMGMERLVPNMDDLALMLSLLPRSATSQKMSVYTQLIQQSLPGQQRHLIILDNGRSRLRHSPLCEALYCIRCGSCLNACPVFRELSGHAYLGRDGSIAPYPGPIGSVVSPGLLGTDFAQLAQASSLCGACKEACPVDIDLTKLLLRVRAGFSPQRTQRDTKEGEGIPGLVKFGLHLFRLAALSPGLFSLAQRTLGLLTGKLAFLPLPAWTGWGLSKDMPMPDAKPFRARFKDLETMTGQNTRESTTSPEPEAQEMQKTPERNPAERFTEELTALGGHVILVNGRDLSGKILAFLGERGIQRVQVWESVPGLDLADLSAHGIQIQNDADATIKAGITGVPAAVAETGTLFIPGGDGRPLTASLLPEIHIAILRASDIHASLENVFSRFKMGENPAVALVSGPSRTADIEMTLTIGVHGPGELHVFLIDDSDTV